MSGNHSDFNNKSKEIMRKEEKEEKINDEMEELNNPIWKIGRILLFITGLWTIFFFFWSFIGISIGTTFVIFSKDNSWRRHGAVLSLSIGAVTFFMDSYRYGLLLLTYLFLFIYLIFYLVATVARLVMIIFRKQRKIKKKQSWSSRMSISRPKLVKSVTIVVIIAPILMWSVVSIDLGVMLDNAPRLLWVHGPSIVNTGDEFALTVEAWDSYERLSTNYKGTIKFSVQSYEKTSGAPISRTDITFPKDYTFTGQFFSTGIIPSYKLPDSYDNGLHAFILRINTPGIHYILVEDSVTKNTYWSNPIMVDHYDETSPRIFWGDLHSHSMVSDGSGSAEESYYYGRNIACLDFMALTDHGEHFTVVGYADRDSQCFQNYVRATNDANAPGKFVSFFGLEWTTSYAIQALGIGVILFPLPISSGGHYTCVFSGDSLPLVSATTEYTTSDLWKTLDDFTASTSDRAIAIPHHTIRQMFIQDWSLMNPDYVKLVEVSSVHGECLFDNELNYRGSVDTPEVKIPGSSVIDAISMGYRMTFIANGDNHDGHPGHSISHTRARVGHQFPFTIYNSRNGHPYPSGITAVQATSLNRNDIFTGLENGRVYSNSDYGRPILDFSINNVSIGYNATVLLPTANATRELTVFLAQGGSPVAKKDQAASVSENWMPSWNTTIEIIKNGVIWKKISVLTPISNITVFDNSTITGTSYNESIQKSDANFYINERSLNPIDPNMLNTGGMDYYAVRVIGSNGRTSYIGPIWVSY
ncbi:MAG: DUF3604 domain-containing protein [Candidatus Hodarchaeales archaeon]